jgi:hypothetical protein
MCEFGSRRSDLDPDPTWPNSPGSDRIRILNTGVGYLVGPAPNPGQEGGGVEAGARPTLFLLVFLVKALPITEKKNKNIFCASKLWFFGLPAAILIKHNL